MTTWTPCYLKNISEEVQDIYKYWTVDEEYLIPDSQRAAYAASSAVLVAIANGTLQVGNGSDYYTDVSEQIDYLKGVLSQEVTTQMEKNDKTLRMYYAFGQADVNGIVKIAAKIPADGRKVAYGDAEFETRRFGDVISKIEVSDLERQIAWMFAFIEDANATEEWTDEEVRQEGTYPYYPVLDYYDDKSIETTAYTIGTIGGGCAMTYQFGNTEVQPLGGYGNLPGGFYLCVEAKNVLSARTEGDKCQFSIDWGEPNE